MAESELALENTTNETWNQPRSMEQIGSFIGRRALAVELDAYDEDFEDSLATAV